MYWMAMQLVYTIGKNVYTQICYTIPSHKRNKPHMKYKSALFKCNNLTHVITFAYHKCYNSVPTGSYFIWGGKIPLFLKCNKSGI